MKKITIIFVACICLLPSLSQAGLNDGLVAHYCFDDANDVAKDCYGTNNGVIWGNVTQTTGWDGNAALFGGYDNPGHIRVPNSPSLIFSDDFSVTFAVNLAGWEGMDEYGAYNETSSTHSVFAKSHDQHGVSLIVWEVAVGDQDNQTPGIRIIRVKWNFGGHHT